MRRVFLDANIYLSFYHLSKDDLSELEKFVRLVRDGEVYLVINSVIIDEVFRNRANKIADGLKNFRSLRFNPHAPAYVRTLPKFLDLSQQIRRITALHAEIMNDLDASIREEGLEADKLIKSLFDNAVNLKVDNTIMQRARLRQELRNPPGKPDSLGDRINWETLLHDKAEKKRDLVIVSDDGDFASGYDTERIDEFLAGECRNTDKDNKLSECELFVRLSTYLNKYHPGIDLNDEKKKDELIANLAESSNFATTHTLIEKMSEFEQFTKRQAHDLFKTLAENNQVSWIISDDDVQEFYQELFRVHKWELAFEAHEDTVCSLLNVTGPTQI